MNYENFSSEAKQAIEHLRNFLIKNQNKFEKRQCDCCTDFVERNYLLNLRIILERSALTFNISFEEAVDVAEFCKSKNYWLDSK